MLMNCMDTEISFSACPASLTLQNPNGRSKLTISTSHFCSDNAISVKKKQRFYVPRPTDLIPLLRMINSEKLCIYSCWWWPLMPYHPRDAMWNHRNKPLFRLFEIYRLVFHDDVTRALPESDFCQWIQIWLFNEKISLFDFFFSFPSSAPYRTPTLAHMSLMMPLRITL